MITVINLEMKHASYQCVLHHNRPLKTRMICIQLHKMELLAQSHGLIGGIVEVAKFRSSTKGNYGLEMNTGKFDAWARELGEFKF